MPKVPFKPQPKPAAAQRGTRSPEPAPEPPREDGPDTDPDTKVDPWCYESSWDLQRGLEVSDQADTVPAELLDELFPPEPPKPKRGGGTA